jgi:hypothetical protein
MQTIAHVEKRIVITNIAGEESGLYEVILLHATSYKLQAAILYFVVKLAA